MLTRAERDILKSVVQLAVFLAVVWLSLPNRPALTPYLWRSAARGAQSVSDCAGDVALWSRSRYWKAVRP